MSSFRLDIALMKCSIVTGLVLLIKVGIIEGGGNLPQMLEVLSLISSVNINCTISRLPVSPVGVSSSKKFVSAFLFH